MCLPPLWNGESRLASLAATSVCVCRAVCMPPWVWPEESFQESVLLYDTGPKVETQAIGLTTSTFT